MNAFKKLLTAAVLLAVAGSGLAQSPKPLEVIAFGGGGNWPVWAAEDKGLFAKNGIAVKLSFTPNSVEQIRNLMSGKYDFGTTAYDNVVAYQEGQGETDLPTQPGWKRLDPDSRVAPWTDDYANILGAILDRKLRAE